MPTISKGCNSVRILRNSFKVNQVIYSSAPTSISNIKALAQIVFLKHLANKIFISFLKGWMDELGFYVPSTVFQSFRGDGRVNMKGSVQ